MNATTEEEGVADAGRGPQWEQDAKAVTQALERLERKLDETQRAVGSLTTEVALLKLAVKLKSGAWGVIGGAIPLLITLVIYLVMRGKA